MAAFLSSDDYIRQRLSPQPGDYLYLHLVDLRDCLKRVVPVQPMTVLDYGCGGSPYKALFQGTYHRADIDNGSDLDVHLNSEMDLPPGVSSHYDVVLSTQVLEHVREPARYLANCQRALKPGGKLILTTHGVFEDHPCPLDLQRWTADGLVELVSRAGFRNVTSFKLTAGPRAALFLLERQLHRFPGGWRGIAHHGMTFPFRLISKLGARRLHQFADKVFSSDRIVDGGDGSQGIYITLAVTAEKPQQGPPQGGLSFPPD